MSHDFERSSRWRLVNCLILVCTVRDLRPCTFKTVVVSCLVRSTSPYFYYFNLALFFRLLNCAGFHNQSPCTNSDENALKQWSYFAKTSKSTRGHFVMLQLNVWSDVNLTELRNKVVPRAPHEKYTVTVSHFLFCCQLCIGIYLKSSLGKKQTDYSTKFVKNFDSPLIYATKYFASCNILCPVRWLVKVV